MTETNAYKLYWCEQSAAEGPALLMEEAGIAYEKISVDLFNGENWESEPRRDSRRLISLSQAAMADPCSV